MTPLEEWLDVSTVEQSGVYCVRLDSGDEAIGVREISDGCGEHGYAGSEDQQNQANYQRCFHMTCVRIYAYLA